MANEANSSTWSKVGFAILVLGFLAFTVGFGAPSWIEMHRNHAIHVMYGLWLYCTEIRRCRLIDSPAAVMSWFQSVRAVECMALLSFISAFLLSILSFSHRFIRRNRIHIMAAFLAGILGLVGVIVFAAETTMDYTMGGLSWGFSQTCIGSLLAVVAAIFMAVGNCNESLAPLVAVRMEERQYRPARVRNTWIDDWFKINTPYPHGTTPGLPPYDLVQQGYELPSYAEAVQASADVHGTLSEDQAADILLCEPPCERPVTPPPSYWDSEAQHRETEDA